MWKNAPVKGYAAISNTDPATIIAAKASQTLYVTDLIISASGGAVAATVKIGTTTVAIVRVLENDTVALHLDAPLVNAVNEALTVTLAANTANVTATGYYV